MDESDFEGTLVLERLAAMGKVEELFDAVDADDPKRVRSLLAAAKLDAGTIAMVIEKMQAGDDEH
jgi:hypothetical protein